MTEYRLTHYDPQKTKRRGVISTVVAEGRTETLMSMLGHIYLSPESQYIITPDDNLCLEKRHGGSSTWIEVYNEIVGRAR